MFVLFFAVGLVQVGVVLRAGGARSWSLYKKDAAGSGQAVDTRFTSLAIVVPKILKYSRERSKCDFFFLLF